MAQTQPHGKMVQVSLLSETATVHPGQSFWVAIKQKIAPGWHTYWVNPGDAGEPMTLEWTLPEGFKAGEIEWPLPHVIPVASLTNYGYSDEALFLVKITAPEKLDQERVTLAAKARWLVCEDVCIPEEGDVELTLPAVPDVGQSIASSNDGVIRDALAQLPKPAAWSSYFETGSDAVRLTLAGAGGSISQDASLRFFPLQWGPIANSGEQKLSRRAADIVLDMPRGEAPGDPPANIKGLLVAEAPGGVRQGYVVEASNRGATLSPGTYTKSESGASSGGLSKTADVNAAGGIGLPAAMLFAFLGGLILNLMPCVFPVLALKALSFAKTEPGEGRVQGMAYLLGVLASFAALGVIITVLRTGGEIVGWGFQFQSPEFVLLMAALFLALGLSLSGVFNIGAGLASTGDRLTQKAGWPGYFFTGVLATVVATPCTAPFMGAALGYALIQPAGITFAVLTALAAGFALPMVLVSHSPFVRRILPRPGAWMETLKQVMAFPLYATAAWLVWVLSVQRGSDGVLAAAVALTGTGFAAWLAGRLQGRDGWLPRLAAPAAAIMLLGLSLGFIRGSTTEAASGQQNHPAEKLAAEAFTPQKLADLRASGRPVLVNFTAAWCITCQVNERIALATPRVQQALKEHDVAYLKADWTNYDPDITAILKSFGRAGVPLYVLYPGGNPEAPPDILPQLLTEGIVLDRISRLASPQPSKEVSNARH